MFPKTFRDAYCERFAIAPGAFEHHALGRCLYPHARLIAFLCRCLGRQPFAPDIDWIRAVAGCTARRQARDELNASMVHEPITSPWRRWLRIRVSGRRVLRLAYLLLS